MNACHEALAVTSVTLAHRTPADTDTSRPQQKTMIVDMAIREPARNVAARQRLAQLTFPETSRALSRQL